MTESAHLRDEFVLDPTITFLNHGSFGACPRQVFAHYQEWQLELERRPVEFLARRIHGLLADARGALGAYVRNRLSAVHANHDDLAERLAVDLECVTPRSADERR